MPKPKVDVGAIISNVKKQKAKTKQNVTFRVDGDLYAAFRKYCESQDLKMVDLIEGYMHEVASKVGKR